MPVRSATPYSSNRALSALFLPNCKSSILWVEELKKLIQNQSQV